MIRSSTGSRCGFILGIFLLPFLLALLAPCEEAELEFQRNWGGQVNFLFGEIESLKADHQICGASVIAHWSMRRIQPLQRRIHFGFQYTGGADSSHYSRSKIVEEDLKDRVWGLLKNVDGTANVAGTFSAGRHPREVLFRVVD